MERISLSNSAFEGNNNVYLFADGPETVLIDTGDWTESTREQLATELGRRGIEFADIDCIFLTHWHPDHTGSAGEIQSQSGADVYIHSRDAPLVEGDEDAWEEMHHIQERYFDEWGMPKAKQQALSDKMAGPEIAGETPTVTSVEDGDQFSFNGYELTIVHTPGHTDGLCSFEMVLDEQRILFSGDALLPVYTPNVGGADVRVERPLEKYLRTLQHLSEANYDRAWPGHRDPIDSPSLRADYVIRHHEERAWRVLETLSRRGTCDTWTVSDELFGDLEGIHILHGPGESYAHLEHLERMGTITREGTRYRLTADTSEDLDQMEAEHWELEY